jgi:TaqI-like C-terminal specificity domain/Eco57I restriction-modification methylase/N-6 DNA Methylase
MEATPAKTVDQGKEVVTKLCRYFTTNRQAFLAPGVKEAHIRQSLIDPLFEALGWDVGNRAMTAPQYREVIPEDSLDVEGQQKAPDYTFRVGSLPKFYAEAKKCGVNIGADPAPAFQLRRYGWSAKLALSILTDFEELGIYDCTMRPSPSEKASHARIQYFHFEEYPDRWRELWDVFSREAVWSGAFDQYAASKRKRGTSEVDVEFLKEMEGWRLALAGNIALRNKNLSLDDLNAAVQLTIDRVVFLRMAEDRGLEPYEQLLKLCERADIYSRFMHDLSRRADQKYNSGLFHFQKESGVSEEPDRITPKLAVDDKVFKLILQSLYFAHGSPYQFGVMPVEILGTVYERFLGKVIRLTVGHQAKIEEKPEVRKAGGVYYTPAYIVEYIVKQTVARQIEGRSPAQLAGSKDKSPFRVLDMACGSGSFLLGAYRCLLDYCSNWYAEHKPENFKKAVYKDPRTGHWRLTIEERKRILTTHIFGVDIDLQAVEVTKLSLLLKVLEGETDQSLSLSQLAFGDRALPNLADNIKCGNSLVGPDYYTAKLIVDPEEIRIVNPFDWKQRFPEAMKAGGFDCIIGNPPYLRVSGINEELDQYIRLNYETIFGHFDYYIAFLERSVRMLNRGGLLGFIVPNKFLVRRYANRFRPWLLNNSTLLSLVDLSAVPVFEGASIYPVVIVLANEKYKHKSNRPLSVATITRDAFPAFVRSGKVKSSEINQERFSLNRNFIFDISIVGDDNAVFKRINNGTEPLGAFARALTGTPAIKLFYEWGSLLVPQHKIKGAVKALPFINVSNVSSYSINWGKEIRAAKKRLATPYLRFHPEYVGENKWRVFCIKPKIVIAGTAKRLTAALDSVGYANLSLYAIVDWESQRAYHINYLLALLNSTLLNFWFTKKFGSTRMSGGYLTYNGVYLEQLPIFKLDFDNAAHRSCHDRLVQLVNQMLELHQKLGSVKSTAQEAILKRQIGATGMEIDRIVYDLYGLTADEIALIEGQENPRSDGQQSAPQTLE